MYVDNACLYQAGDAHTEQVELSAAHAVQDYTCGKHTIAIKK